MEGLTCSLVLCRDVEDAIGIDVKNDINLWHPTRCRWDTTKLKLAQKIVVPCSGPLSLIDLNEDSWLVVRVCGEDLLLLCGDSCVPWNECCLQRIVAMSAIDNRTTSGM